MSDLVPQCGYRPPINPYYKCFTDVRYDPFLSSIVFFNRFIKQPVAYLDARLFLNNSVSCEGLVNVEIVNKDNHVQFLFYKSNGEIISTDISLLSGGGASGGSLSTVELQEEDKKFYLVFNLISGDTISTDVTKLYNTEADIEYLLSGLVDITAAYEYQFSQATDVFVEFLGRWQKKHPDKVRPFNPDDIDD